MYDQQECFAMVSAFNNLLSVCGGLNGEWRVDWRNWRQARWAVVPHLAEGGGFELVVKRVTRPSTVCGGLLLRNKRLALCAANAYGELWLRYYGFSQKE